MVRQFDVKKLPPKQDKFQLPENPMKSNITFKKEPMEVFQIKVRGRNASVKEANGFIYTTMKTLFNKTPTGEKKYQVLYKLTDGRWYSSKFLQSLDDDVYPDLRDPEYGIDVEGENVEHIRINSIKM